MLLKAWPSVGIISKATERLPGWAQVLVIALAIAASLYEIVHYGFWSFLLHFIFSPMP